MTTFIFTITLLNNNDNIEYKVIEGVYSDKETAKAEATKKAKLQKELWPDSYFMKLGKGRLGLRGGLEGFSKIYEIKEMEVK